MAKIESLTTERITQLISESKSDLLGGTSGQYLKKTSEIDYDFEWVTLPSGGYGPNWVAAVNTPAAIKTAIEIAGGYICDGVGDQAEIISALSSYGEVNLSIGGFNIDATIDLPARRYLHGSGVNTVLTGTSGLSGRFIQANNDHPWISDMLIAGGAEAAGTHHIDSNITSSTGFITGSDACLIIERVVSKNSKGRGLNLDGSYNRDSKLHAIHVWNAASDGYYISTPDGNAIQLIAGTCGGNGVWMESDANNWTISASKCWYSDLDGWLINGIRSKYVGIEGQDNLGAGIRVIGNNIIVSDWLADSNSYNGTDPAAMTGNNVHSGLELGRKFDQTSSGGYDLSIGPGQSWDKNEGSRGYRQAYGVRARSGIRGLVMNGVATGDPAGTHHNVTGGILFDTATDKDHANNAIRGCLSHRARFESV